MSTITRRGALGRLAAVPAALALAAVLPAPTVADEPDVEIDDEHRAAVVATVALESLQRIVGQFASHDEPTAEDYLAALNLFTRLRAAAITAYGREDGRRAWRQGVTLATDELKLTVAA